MCYAGCMAIVFGFDDDELEPIDWAERSEFLDGAAWLPEQLTESVVFFDAAHFDQWNPVRDIEAILRSVPEGPAMKMERWGYLQAGNDGSRQAISKLEHERGASPLIRYHYGTGSVLVAVISMPVVFDHLIARCLARHTACLDVILIVRPEGLPALVRE